MLKIVSPKPKFNAFFFTEGNEGGQFAVEPRTNVIYLVKELNREESATHTVQVAASNSPNPINVLPANTLTVTVVVSSHHILLYQLLIPMSTDHRSFVIKKVLAYNPIPIYGIEARQSGIGFSSSSHYFCSCSSA